MKLVATTHSAFETRALAERLAKCLRADDCLALTGGFGSGKTTFVQGLAQGLGVRKNSYVCSPSFVILKMYRGRRPIYHFDLYRLNRPQDIANVGLGEFVDAGGISVIEWAQKARSFLPREALAIKFSIAGRQQRRLEFFPRSVRLKQAVRRALKRSL